jgi:hypothetical protein
MTEQVPIMLLYFENNADWAAVTGCQTLSQFLIKWWQVVKIGQKNVTVLFYDSKLFTKNIRII